MGESKNDSAASPCQRLLALVRSGGDPVRLRRLSNFCGFSRIIGGGIFLMEMPFRSIDFSRDRLESRFRPRAAVKGER
jgi:hypothetical protein